jgi:hypothetical protein
MIEHTVSAHTHCDRVQDDPLTALHVMRRTAQGISVVLSALSAGALAAGLWEDSLQVWNLGLTLLGIAAMAGIVSAITYVGELVIRTQRDLDAGQCEISARLDALEAGERALAGAMRKMSDPADELGQRREGGR